MSERKSQKRLLVHNVCAITLQHSILILYDIRRITCAYTLLLCAHFTKGNIWQKMPVTSKIFAKFINRAEVNPRWN